MSGYIVAGVPRKLCRLATHETATEGPAIRSLLDAPSPATVTLRGENDTLITSPVWFRAVDDVIEWVVAANDHKLELLRRDPRCIPLTFEAGRPFRGLEVRDVARIEPDHEARVRLAIATRDLGSDGQAYADVERRPPGSVVRLPFGSARAWDLGDKLP